MNWYDESMKPGEVIGINDKSGKHSRYVVMQINHDEQPLLSLVNMDTFIVWGEPVPFGSTFKEAIGEIYLEEFFQCEFATEVLFDKRDEEFVHGWQDGVIRQGDILIDEDKIEYRAYEVYDSKWDRAIVFINTKSGLSFHRVIPCGTTYRKAFGDRINVLSLYRK